MVWVYSRSGPCMGTGEDPWWWFFKLVHVQFQLLAMSSDGLLETPSNRIPPDIHTVRLCSQPSAKSGCFCSPVEAVYWFVFQTIDLDFMGITFVVKLPTKSCFQAQNDCLQISSSAKYFPSCVQGISLMSISCYRLFFLSNLNKIDQVHYYRQNY